MRSPAVNTRMKTGERPSAQRRPTTSGSTSSKRPKSRQIALFLPEKISLETTNVSMTPSSVHMTQRMVRRAREGTEAYREPSRGGTRDDSSTFTMIEGGQAAPMWEMDDGKHHSFVSKLKGKDDRGPDLEQMAVADLTSALAAAVRCLKRELAHPTRLHNLQREYVEPRMVMMQARRRQKKTPGLPLRYYYAPSTVMREKGVRAHLIAERAEEHEDEDGGRAAPTLLSWLTKKSGAKYGSWAARSVIATEHVQRRRLHVLSLLQTEHKLEMERTLTLLKIADDASGANGKNKLSRATRQRSGIAQERISAADRVMRILQDYCFVTGQEASTYYMAVHVSLEAFRRDVEAEMAGKVGKVRAAVQGRPAKAQAAEEAAAVLRRKRNEAARGGAMTLDSLTTPGLHGFDGVATSAITPGYTGLTLLGLTTPGPSGAQGMSSMLNLDTGNLDTSPRQLQRTLLESGTMTGDDDLESDLREWRASRGSGRGRGRRRGRGRGGRCRGRGRSYGGRSSRSSKGGSSGRKGRGGQRTKGGGRRRRPRRTMISGSGILRPHEKRTPALPRMRDLLSAAPTGVAAGHFHDEFAEKMRRQRRALLQGLPNVDGPATFSETRSVLKQMIVKEARLRHSDGALIEAEMRLPPKQTDMWLLPPKNRGTRSASGRKEYSDLCMRRM